MTNRKFQWQLLLRTLLIVFTTLALPFLWQTAQYLLFVLCLLALVLEIYTLIYFLNTTNRKIAYFFNAIRNEDFTLRFPENVAMESFQELNTSLNRVNHIIQEVHTQLQVRENYYQEILKRAEIGILTYNRKGHILFSNPTVEKLLNHAPLNHIKQLIQIDPKLYETFLAFETYDHKLVQLTNEREKTQLSLKSSAISLDGQELLLVVVQDIQRALEEKETDSWSKLIRVLTHEIMNTITPITSISGSILGFFKKNGETVAMEDISVSHIQNTVKGLEVIREQGTDLMEFVQSYRSLLQVPVPDRSLIKANNLLEKVRLLMEPNPQTQEVSLEFSCQPEALELYVDEKQLTLVLLNLVKNALQALSDQQDAQLKVTAGIANSGHKFIEVSDNGPGIPEEVADQIFVPFFTTKEKGTGIGLSLSKQIMHLHGGAIKVHSQLGTGTTFLLEFS